MIITTAFLAILPFVRMFKPIIFWVKCYLTPTRHQQLTVNIYDLKNSKETGKEAAITATASIAATASMFCLSNNPSDLFTVEGKAK